MSVTFKKILRKSPFDKEGTGKSAADHVGKARHSGYHCQTDEGEEFAHAGRYQECTNKLRGGDAQ